MRVNGLMTRGMEEVSKGTPIIIPTLDISKMEKLTARVSINGAMVRYMMESGSKASSMDTGCGLALMDVTRI